MAAAGFELTVSVAPVAVPGPALPTTTGYVKFAPCGTDATPSVKPVTGTSAFGDTTVSGPSVAVLFAAFGSVTLTGAVTVAVLLTVVPMAPVTLAVRVNVAVPPPASVTVVLMFPLPLAAPTDDPELAVAVHVAPLNPDPA